MTIVVRGPVEFLDIAFWTINNKISATGKCFLGVIDGVYRDLSPVDKSHGYIDTIRYKIRDRVSLHDAIAIVEASLDRIADINGLHELRREVQMIDHLERKSG